MGSSCRRRFYRPFICAKRCWCQRCSCHYGWSRNSHSHHCKDWKASSSWKSCRNRCCIWWHHGCTRRSRCWTSNRRCANGAEALRGTRTRCGKTSHRCYSDAWFNDYQLVSDSRRGYRLCKCSIRWRRCFDALRRNICWCICNPSRRNNGAHYRAHWRTWPWSNSPTDK